MMAWVTEDADGEPVFLSLEDEATASRGGEEDARKWNLLLSAAAEGESLDEDATALDAGGDGITRRGEGWIPAVWMERE